MNNQNTQNEKNLITLKRRSKTSNKIIVSSDESSSEDNTQVKKTFKLLKSFNESIPSYYKANIG